MYVRLNSPLGSGTLLCCFDASSHSGSHVIKKFKNCLEMYSMFSSNITVLMLCGFYEYSGLNT